MYHVYPSNKPSPMDNAHLENGRKFTYWKMTEKAHMENERMENARHGR